MRRQHGGGVGPQPGGRGYYISSEMTRIAKWEGFYVGALQVDPYGNSNLLGIPDGITQVALIPVAYTKGTNFRPAKRPPVTEITHWNHWGDTGA